MIVNVKHRRTLSAIFSDPIRANILWDDIESLFIALGAQKKEGSGSRTRFTLNGVHGLFHRPHPRKEVIKPAIKDVRRFLIEAGIKEEDYDE
jgi:hypothetical protein